VHEFAGSFANLVPTFSIQAEPVGVGGSISFGGSNVAGSMAGFGASIRAVASRVSHEAGKAAKIGSYARREQDWKIQSNLAVGEIAQITKQLRAAQIREFIAKRELDNHRAQMTQAQEIEDFLAGETPGGKTTPLPTTRGCAGRSAGCTTSATSSPWRPPARLNARCATNSATRH